MLRLADVEKPAPEPGEVLVKVLGVTSTRNIDLVRSLGADDVVDYTTTDFTHTGQRYDLILDTIGNRSVSDLRRALADGGRAAVTGFTSVRKLMGVFLRGGKDIAQVSATWNKATRGERWS